LYAANVVGKFQGMIPPITAQILDDLLLDLIVEIDAVHLGQREQVKSHVGQLLAKIGPRSTPRLEALGDFAVQQHELQGDIARVEPFGDLVLPGELLGFLDFQGSPRGRPVRVRQPTYGALGNPGALHQRSQVCAMNICRQVRWNTVAARFDGIAIQDRHRRGRSRE
jgi:hypothetical protein